MKEEKILSIRLSPDGLSFWTTGLKPGATETANDAFCLDLWSRTQEKSIAFDPATSQADNIAEAFRQISETAGNGFASVEIYPDSSDTVVVPAEYFQNDSLEGYLAVNNITISPEETAFVTSISGDVMAIIVHNSAAVETLKRLAGAEIPIKSLFSVNDSVIGKYGASKRPVAAIYLAPANAYISVYESKTGERLYAETFKWAAGADILYYMSLLDKEFGLKKSKVYLRGAGTQVVYKLLRKYFRKSRCE